MNEEHATGPRLSELTGVQVRVQSETVTWTDGPTVPQMKGLVAEHGAPADRNVTYRRTSSAIAWAARAIAVHGVFSVDLSALRDLRRPDWRNLPPGQRLALDVVQQAIDETPYPNRPDSAEHEAPIHKLLSAADHDKTRLAEILLARVVDSSLNRRSFTPYPTMVIYRNSRRRSFYCTRCGKTQHSQRFAVAGHDWNKVWCESCY
jgi:hypothetical protein